MRYRRDRDVELLDGGRAVLGGDPIRLLRLSDAGAAIVAGWADEVEVEVDDPATVGVRALVERMVDAGVLHPVAAAVGGAGARVDVVVPVRDRVEALDRCLGALRRAGSARIVVVDDASVDAVGHRDVAARHGAELVRLDRNLGPAGARSAGVAATTSDVVAFVDSDVEVTAGWLDGLVGHLDDERVALVAPRVRHAAATGTSLERFERVASPLDLGARPAWIVAGTRVSYVPAAALVVRRAAFDGVGGFDPTMQVGEDVDLVWRLADAGWRCRYEPSVVVHHVGRSTAAGLLARRFDYGRSAAALDARHPGSLAPVRLSRWSAVIAVATGAGHPVVAAGVAGVATERLARRLAPLPAARTVAWRLVGRGQLGALRQVAVALVRPWFPLTWLAAWCSRRFRRVAIVAVVAQRLLDRRRRPDGGTVGAAAWVALSLADDVAYSAGVWAGCWRHRRWGPLLPRSPGLRSPAGGQN